MLLCFIYFDGAEIKDTTTTTSREENRSILPNIAKLVRKKTVPNLTSKCRRVAKSLLNLLLVRLLFLKL